MCRLASLNAKQYARSDGQGHAERDGGPLNFNEHRFLHSVVDGRKLIAVRGMHGRCNGARFFSKSLKTIRRTKRATLNANNPAKQIGVQSIAQFTTGTFGLRRQI